MEGKSKSLDDSNIRGIRSRLSKSCFMSLSRRKRNQNNDNINIDSVTITENNLKQKNENIFLKFKRTIQKRFPLKIIKFSENNEISNDSNEFNSSKNIIDNNIKILTKDYREEYLIRKWKRKNSELHQVMYNACSEMLSHAWYWGEISRHFAERQLKGKPNGSFLVRDSETDGLQFTLSFRIRNYVFHYRIQYRNNHWYFEPWQYQSIVEMIQDIMTKSTDEDFACYIKSPCEMQPPFPVRLTYPLSRYSVITTLQGLCRRVIKKNINPDKVKYLPIPSKLQQYLIEQSPDFF